MTEGLDGGGWEDLQERVPSLDHMLGSHGTCRKPLVECSSIQRLTAESLGRRTQCFHVPWDLQPLALAETHLEN